MRIEDYFEFVNDETILVKGTRVGIEVILRDYLEGASPEEILLRYPTLTLEQVHATIAFYLHNKDEIDRYLQRCWQEGEEAWKSQQDHPSDFLRDLRERISRQRSALQDEGRLIALPREK